MPAPRPEGGRFVSPVHMVFWRMSDATDTPLHRIRADLIERLRLYEEGVITTHSRTDEGTIETTSETIARIRSNIAELNRVIDGLPRR